MLSSLATRTGALGAILRSRSAQQAVCWIQKNDKSDVAKQIDEWDKADKIFYGPERDAKNFPLPEMPAVSGKVRLGVIPDDWFQFLYKKTGVTGPYLFGTGLLAFLLSKEIWVIDHNFSEVIGFWGAVILLNKKLGPLMGKWLDKQVEAVDSDDFESPIKKAKEVFHTSIAEAEKEIWRQDGQKYLFQAKKENIALQLEASYRQRLQSVYEEVKKRLDYELDMQNTKRQFEQEHMVNWIVQNVIKSITPQQEKESIGKCIQNLQQLSKNAAVS